MLRDVRAEGQPGEVLVDRRGQHVLACSRCLRVITSPADRIEVGGAHEHVFVNPAGERFRIGCFGGASGLLRVGPSMIEWTWFPGYTWQSQLCARCQTFMGWLYRRGDHRFHGLVIEALILLER